MSTHRKGGASTLVIGIVALLLVGGGIWYFVSDPFHQRVKDAMEGWTKWTPENIAKDPATYLNFCEDQAKKAKEKLKVSEISVNMSLGKLGQMLTENKAKVETGSKALDELRNAYNQSPTVTWPVKFGNASLSEVDFKRQVKNLDRETKSAAQLQRTVETGIGQLKAQLTKIQEAKFQADEQLATIASKREMLKVQAITQDLTNQLVDMKSALQATITTTDETSNVKSLADLTAASNAGIADSEFDALMKKN